MKSVLVYTLHKTGSTFINKLCDDLCQFLNIDGYSIYNNDNRNKINDTNWKEFIIEKGDKACFYPVRVGRADPSVPDDLSNYSSIAHVRDPRDILVSHYFSKTFSHPRQEGRFNPSDEQRDKWKEKGIDQNVLEHCPNLVERYEYIIKNILSHKETKLVKYEEMVTDYSGWLEQFLEAFSHFPIPTQKEKIFFKKTYDWKMTHEKFYNKYKNEFKITKENVSKHKRKITPGDYKEKLQESTINKLNDEFKDILKILHY